MTTLLTDNLPLLAGAPNGIKKLRELILELAIRGKLVAQDPGDEPASELLKHIEAKKQRLVIEEGMRTTARDDIPKDEHYLKLNAGWEYARLGNLARFIDYRGRTPTKTQSGIPLITAKNVRMGFISREPQEFIAEIDYPSWMTRGFPRLGDMLFTTEAPLGNISLIDISEQFALAQRVICFQLHDLATGPFLQLAMMSSTLQVQFLDVSTGMTATGIKASRLKEIPVPIPPLAEQHRIVAKVDELMALCDRLEAQQADAESAHIQLVQALLGSLTQVTDAADFTANWQRLAEHFHTLFTTEPGIDALKQTLLQLAVMGKLVPQDPNDESVSTILPNLDSTKEASHLTKQDKQSHPFPLPSQWRWETLNKLLERGREISYGIIKLGIEPKQGGIATLRCSDVKPGYIDLHSVRKVSQEIESEYTRTRLTGGEIVINIRGTLGGVAVVNAELAGYNVAREVAVIPVSKQLSGHYMAIAMQSNYFWSAITAELRGIAYKGLNLGSLRLFPIPIPPVQEQHRIVEKINQLTAICDQLKSQIRLASKLNEQLTNNLVKEALA
ncbi:restriction endonuclease subunit S [Pseudomonas syringae]|nr:restriction endonuclease subunit S [Pseudomonas syringae]MBD8799849.1 restriction endonuclease subunit S [Pseudomonas syringae]MBD8811155.1 restriction endonuclease subunit S [Pseudomonas syringae]